MLESAVLAVFGSVLALTLSSAAGSLILRAMFRGEMPPSAASLDAKFTAVYEAGAKLLLSPFKLFERSNEPRLPPPPPPQITMQRDSKDVDATTRM